VDRKIDLPLLTSSIAISLMTDIAMGSTVWILDGGFIGERGTVCKLPCPEDHANKAQEWKEACGVGEGYECPPGEPLADLYNVRLLTGKRKGVVVCFMQRDDLQLCGED